MNLSNKSARNGGAPRKPLISAKEIADEFGLSMHALNAYIGHHNGPEPVFRKASHTTRNSTWYDPAEMRKWWKQVQEQKGVNA